MTAEKKKLYITQQVLLLCYKYVPRKFTSVGESFDKIFKNISSTKWIYTMPVTSTELSKK